MKQIASLVFVLLVAAAAMPFAAPAAASTGSVKVTINYKGKGTFDAKHRVWVWLFDTPDIGPGSMPIAEVSIDANGSVATFDGIDVERVYIAAAFDESGTMSGSAPPPSGSPIGILMSADGRPKNVAPGEVGIVLTFDDSQRMP